MTDIYVYDNELWGTQVGIQLGDNFCTFPLFFFLFSSLVGKDMGCMNVFRESPV